MNERTKERTNERMNDVKRLQEPKNHKESNHKSAVPPGAAFLVSSRQENRSCGPSCHGG